MKETLTFGKGVIIGAASVLLLLLVFCGIFFLIQKSGKESTKVITTTPMTDILDNKPEREKKQTEEDNQENSQENSQEESLSGEEASDVTETDETGKVSKTLTLSFQKENSWGEDTDKKYVQWKGILTNNSTETVSDWKVELKLPLDAKVDQYWNFTGALKDGTYSITPASYTQTVEASKSIEFGLILINGGDITEEDFQVYADSLKVETGSQEEKAMANTDTNTSVETSVLTDKTLTLSQDDWLYVKDNKIVDKDGKEVWITGINWFGYNTGTNTFDGLWAADLNSSLKAIADHGFNLIRLPISSELILNWKQGIYPTANFNQAINSYLVELNSLEILDYVVNQCHKNGIK
ncbi:MAG: cellulase family glycosylhydrolase, partial [Clostridiales bacterium]|nr:cellulase family glycosylhydrolase [Clostridiales bacterium]